MLIFTGGGNLALYSMQINLGLKSNKAFTQKISDESISILKKSILFGIFLSFFSLEVLNSLSISLIFGLFNGSFYSIYLSISIRS